MHQFLLTQFRVYRELDKLAAGLRGAQSARKLESVYGSTLCGKCMCTELFYRSLRSAMKGITAGTVTATFMSKSGEP